ncbi:hypothetical protein SAMN03159341_102242 [Paenibacillus sp. 1_12]|uniref:hypothetical protein n=1 Tax=Paenibacillus sp. 1_12 TaxID=1566278 RepID=UPI0008E15230|nr:hypothetical protein [Paenibacillus sp. 1_12]SFK93448.1 hypothetical protein SAMN03159341_102242 [Paenibacillus sp. 1_12]
MKFDYCEFENESEQSIEIDMGCRFDDEPDELYVIQIMFHKDGTSLGLKLLFNGLDCKYQFKPEEKSSIIDYILHIVPDTAYKDWFEGSLHL